MILFISNFFEALQILSFNFFDLLYDFVFVHFFAPVFKGSILDYTLITPIVGGTILDFTLACFVVPFGLTFIFLSGRGIVKIVRDTAVALGGAGSAYTAIKMSRDDDNDRLRREAEQRAAEAEAQRDQAEQRIQELEAEKAAQEAQEAAKESAKTSKN
jgi:hypothetical protein